MKSMNITTLKAKASQAIREVRQGRIITVLERDIPVAQIIPIRQERKKLHSQKPKRKLTWPKVDVHIDVDPLTYLLEDRNNRF
ncbi:MAG: hypothetical protein JSR44_03760 [Spirochaetes bacterium]|nr:hypothetical protein [Spirochaetota bacterium]